MGIKQCPSCKRNVSLTKFQWDTGAELPKDCPWCNKTIKKKEVKPREHFYIESKPKYHDHLEKGA